MGNTMQTILCVFCETLKETVQDRQLNTAYVDKQSNYMCSCLECWQETINYYNELWQEYYAAQGYFP